MLFGLELVPGADGATPPEWEPLLALAPDLVFVAEPPGLDNDAQIAALGRRLGSALVPHLTTRNRNAEDVAERVGRWRGLGVERVLALRGDQSTACDLARDPRLRSGRELIQLLQALDPDLELWCAAYPETHPEAASAEADLRSLLAKQDAGAAAAVCQFSFTRESYLRFRDQARAAGLVIPLLAGVMPLRVELLPFARRCGARIPAAVEQALTHHAADTDGFAAWGVDHAVTLARELRGAGADGLQLYPHNQPVAARAVAAALGR